jgi:Brp/Blh family beta-carotene 15,15'-monooxygenase
LFWLNYPEISLSLFLLISVFHWGESDALPKKTDESNIIRYLCETTFYGSALLSLNTIFYSQDLVELYAYLSDSEFSQKIVAVSSLVVPITISAFTYLIFHYLKKGQKQKVLEISLIFITMICLKPLIAFLLYFCFFHSPKHLIDFFHYKKEKSDYLKKMLLASIISIGFLLTFNFFIDKDMIQYASSINLGLFRSVFICLAALTIPHVVLVVLWHRESRN